jgi:putative transposase
MPRKRYSVDQIIPMLRRADVELGQGKKIPEVCKQLGITQQTYYRWRQKYGSMQPEMSKELKTLQKENARLKRLVADQALDMLILKEAAKGNF